MGKSSWRFWYVHVLLLERLHGPQGVERSHFILRWRHSSQANAGRLRFRKGNAGGDTVVATGAGRLSPGTFVSILLPQRHGLPRCLFGDGLMDIINILQRGITDIYERNSEMTNLPHQGGYIEGAADNYRGFRRYGGRLLVHLSTFCEIT